MLPLRRSFDFIPSPNFGMSGMGRLPTLGDGTESLGFWLYPAECAGRCRGLLNRLPRPSFCESSPFLILHPVWHDKAGTLAKYGIPISRMREFEDDERVP
jgi:hypothetical protein